MTNNLNTEKECVNYRNIGKEKIRNGSIRIHKIQFTDIFWQWQGLGLSYGIILYFIGIGIFENWIN